MLYGVPMPGVFEGKEIHRFPRKVWVYPIPIRGRFRGKKVCRFPRTILAGRPLIVSRKEGQKLGNDVRKKTGRPKIYATPAERKKAYRQRRALKEGRFYGQ